MLSPTRRILRIALPLLLFLTTGSMGVHAQEAQSSDAVVLSELPAEQIGEAANALLTSINSLVEESQRLEAAIPGSSEEDSLVSELQIFHIQQKFIDDLHALAGALHKLEETAPQIELRAQVEDLFVRVTRPMIDFCNELRTEIDAVRARRSGTAPEARSAIEDDAIQLTQRLDIVLALTAQHLEETAQLKLDTSVPVADYQALLIHRALELSGRIELAIDRIDNLEARLRATPGEASNALLLIATKKSLDNNTSSLDKTLRLMESHKLDTSSFRALLVTATRDISAGLLDSGVAAKLLSRATSSATDWLVASGPRLLVKLLLFLGVLLVFRVLARLVRVGLEKALSAATVTLSQLAQRMLVGSVANIVMFLGFLVALSQLGISLGPLLAGLGVAGFVVGFALQDTLGNFAAGVMILLYRPYDVGDLVDIAGAFGTVNKMSLVSTTILTLDNQTVVVPNSKIWGNVIKNITAQDIRRVDMTFGISYSDDIPKAEHILMEILKTHDKVLESPEPNVKLHTLGESSVDFIVRPWVNVADYWDVYWDVTRAVKMRFDEEGVSIPFPQRDVHLHQNVSKSSESTPSV